MSMVYDEGTGLYYEVNDDPLMTGGGTPPPVGGSGSGNSNGQPTTDPNPAPPPAAGGGVSAAEQAVIDYYNKYLGRPPQAGDVQKWLSGEYGWGGASNLGGIETGIKMSEEAARRRAATASTSYSGAAYNNFATTGNDYSAFNTGRQQDPGKSAKDAFVLVSNQAPAPPMGDKAALEKWFTTYIAPGMNSLGHKVTSISGDGFTYTNGEGTFKVDFVQNAGASSGTRLQWNATPADAATAAKYGTGSNSVTGTGGNGGYAGGGGGGGASGYSSSTNFPTLDIPGYVPYPDYVPEQWNAPQPEDVYKDPAYQFRLTEGMKPLANSRALSGLMRGGATMKAMNRYGQNFASDEFGRVYDRAAQDYARRETTRKGAYDTNLNNYNTAYGFNVNEATGEFAPRNEWAKLQYGRDWDVYKYQNDDAYRYYAADLNAATQGSQYGHDPNA